MTRLNWFSRLLYRFFKGREIKISYGITVCDEHVEFERLMTCMVNNIDPRDEIVILTDEGKVTQEVLALIKKYSDKYPSISHISGSLNRDFSTFKNKLIGKSSGNYLFQIDADEIPNALIFRDIRYILHVYQEYDSFCIPRVNILDGVTKEYLEKGDISIDEKNRINFPDYQQRLFKLNGNIQWVNKLHEVLVNYKKNKRLPSKNEDYCLYHHKTLEKANKQHAYYQSIEQ